MKSNMKNARFEEILSKVFSHYQGIETLILEAARIALDEWFRSGQMGMVNRLYWRVGDSGAMSAYKAWILRHTDGCMKFASWSRETQDEHYVLAVAMEAGIDADSMSDEERVKIEKMLGSWAKEGGEKRAAKLDGATLKEVFKSPQQYLPVFHSVANQAERMSIDSKAGPTGNEETPYSGPVGWNHILAETIPPVRAFKAEDTKSFVLRKVVRIKQRSPREVMETAVVMLNADGATEAMKDKAIDDIASGMQAIMSKKVRAGMLLNVEARKAKFAHLVRQCFTIPDPNAGGVVNENIGDDVDPMGVENN